MTFRNDALDALKHNAEKDRSQALASLKVMLDNPAGIGDHSTGDLHNNLNEALSQLADAEDRLDILKVHFNV
tara:strand:- start:3394 stop:3609 length:216 start_codon:yes stop_codon:yes gene_type:complete